VVALLGAGCSESEPESPRPLQVQPDHGSSDKASPVTISGQGFSPLVRVDYCNKKRSSVSTAFGASLGPHALQQVTFQNHQRLTALVPAGLPAGTYDLIIVDPRGRRGELADAFRISDVELDAGPDAAPDAGPDAAPDIGVDGPLPDLPRTDLKVPDQTQPDTAPPGAVSTLAGTGKPGFQDGVAATAQFENPRGVEVTGGSVYVADYANHRVRAINAGQVTTLAGSGVQGFKDGPAATAQLNFPAGLAVQGGGGLLVADSANDRIRVVWSGQVTTLAGSGVKGFLDGAAATARFQYPQGVAEAAGTVYVADTENHRIRMIKGGQVTTLAGSGVKGFLDGAATVARFNAPTDVAVSGSTVYVADSGNNRVRAVALGSGAVSTVAGTGAQGAADGPATSQAQFWSPLALAVWGTRLYIADQSNHRIRVLEQGAVTTVTGDYFGFKDGPIDQALFYYPSGLAFDTSGPRLVVGDQSNHRIRLVTFQ
jgi:hypothetical protein